MILALLLLVTAISMPASIPDAEQLVGPPQGIALHGAALTQRTQEIASRIRCPVCQGLSIADSPSEMAVNMKAQVGSLLERGYTRPQIESYFVGSYGEFVLLEPKFQGFSSLVWILPIAALLFGAAVAAVKLRRLASTPSPIPPPTTNDRELARVRELVKGATP